MTILMTIGSGLLVALIAALAWCRQDYRAWTALGPGGLPLTLKGWCTMTWLRTKMGEPIRTEVLDPHIGQPGDRAYLAKLIRRNGPRPRIAVHPIPHRQLDQHGPTGMRGELQAVFDVAVGAHPGLVEYKLSFYEKHAMAVTLCHPECGHVYAIASHGEIGHIHPTDGSMHMILSPSDAKQAIDNGWGERHGLAGSPLLPLTYLFVYSPRDSLEVSVASSLLNAAISHMVGPDAVAAASIQA